MAEKVHDLVVKESTQNQEFCQKKKQDFKPKITPQSWESTEALREQYVFRNTVRGFCFCFLCTLSKMGAKVLEL